MKSANKWQINLSGWGKKAIEAIAPVHIPSYVFGNSIYYYTRRNNSKQKQ